VAIRFRKWVTFSEDIVADGGRELERPLRRVAVAVVCSNPYAGRWSDDLSELIDLGEVLGDELMRRCQEALGGPVESYGKGGIVGEHGELEHIAAVLHPKFGAPTRGRVGGVSILPSVKKRAAMGASLDVPLHHIKAMLVRSHFDAMSITVPDAPGADELLLALAVADGGRPFARVGGLLADDAVGEDGLH
jgi:Amino acid synthesis